MRLGSTMVWGSGSPQRQGRPYVSGRRPGLALVGITMVLMMFSGPTASAQEVDRLPPSIGHFPCENYQKGKPFTVVTRFYDDSPLFDPKVVYRTNRVKEWRSVNFEKEAGSDDFSATIRARDLRGPLEYFIETFDEMGNGPARYGSPEAPIRLTPSDSPLDCTQTEDPKQTTTLDPSRRERPDKVGKSGETLGAKDPTRSSPIPLDRPPPKKDSCELADAPIYCSGAFWAVVSLAGVAALAGGGVGIAYGLGAFDAPASDRLHVTINASTGDVVDGSH